MIRCACALLLVLMLGCSQSLNPCPAGSEADRLAQRCVRTQESLDELDGGAGDAQFSTSEAGLDWVDAAKNMEAGIEGGASEAGSVPVEEAGAPTDGGMEGGACSASDIEAWRGFHLADGAVATMGACILEHCDAGTCYPATCIREAAGLTACEECVDAESACMLEFCNSACGWPGNDSECRACGCESGCVERFDSCAETKLEICANVHGRDALPEEFNVRGPWLARMKRGTGFLQIGPLNPKPPYKWGAVYNSHQSEGFTHLVAFAAGPRQFLLQHKSQCGNDPCIARVSPVLSDGSLGRPVYQGVWSRGWDVIEVFALDGEPHLLRYKTGLAPTQGESSGHLRIDCVAFDETLTQAVLVPRFDLPNTPINAATWSALMTFELGGATYLLRFGNAREGEVEILRMEATQDAFTLVSVTSGLHWSQGWDVFEIIQGAHDVFVIAYKSGRLAVTQEPAGSARALKLVAPSSGQLGFAPVFAGNWGHGVGTIRSFVYQGKRHLLAAPSFLGDFVLRELSSDSTQWDDELNHAIWSEPWNASSPWDLIDVVQGPSEAMTP